MQMKKEDYFICALLTYAYYWAGGHYWYTGEKSKAWTNLILGVFIAPFTCGISTIVLMILGIIKGLKFLITGIKLMQAENEQKQLYQPIQPQQNQYQELYQKYKEPYGPAYQQPYFSQYQQQNIYEKKDS